MSTVFLGTITYDLKRCLIGKLHVDWERVHWLLWLAGSLMGILGLCQWSCPRRFCICPRWIPSPRTWAVLCALLEGLLQKEMPNAALPASCGSPVIAFWIDSCWEGGQRVLWLRMFSWTLDDFLRGIPPSQFRQPLSRIRQTTRSYHCLCHRVTFTAHMLCVRHCDYSYTIWFMLKMTLK